MLISHPAGGGYDLYARLFARHLARFLPGNPTVVPQNMPGAAGVDHGEPYLFRRAAGRHGDRARAGIDRHRRAVRLEAGRAMTRGSFPGSAA